jgi:hypothetical protein
MQWLERWTWRVAAALLTATLAACGGKSGNGSTGPEGDVGQIAGEYGLAMVDGVTAPVTIDFDNCGSIRFRAGGVSLAEDGTWEMAIRLFDANGDEQELQDEGRFQRAGDRLAFQSDEYGDRFAGEVDAALVHLYYDWCGEGHADVDFAFTR